MPSDKTRSILAVIIIVGLFAFIGGAAVLVAFGKPPLPSDQFGLVWSGLLALAGGATGYYFGSSKGSDRKTELMNAAPAAAAVTLPVEPPKA